MGREARARELMQREVRESERFFYHSFPRRASGASSVGLAILESMVTSGLLLVPETIQWQEPLVDGELSKPFYVAQKRICFTELAESELAEHSRRFGPFSLEFSIQSLRQLGAIPVFYVPPGRTDQYLESIGNALMARMLEIEQLLDRLSQIGKVISGTARDDETIAITVDGHAVGTLSMNVGQARELFRVLFHESQPVEQLLNAMRASAGFLYPTEDLTFTTTLGYYRQREWRIVSAMVKRGTEVSRSPTQAEIDGLVALDPEFFGKELPFRTGPSTRAIQSQFMREIGGRHVLTFARRLFCPADAVDRAKAILASVPNGPEVVQA